MLDSNKILIDHQGDTACGDDYEYDSLLVEIRQAMEGKPEQKMDDDNIIAAEEPNWRLVKNLPDGVVRRQDAPNVYAMNASIYVWQRDSLTHASSQGLWNGRIKLHAMPHERSAVMEPSRCTQGGQALSEGIEMA